MIRTALVVLLAAACSQETTWVRPDGVTHRVSTSREPLLSCDSPDAQDHCDCDRDSDCDEAPNGECHRGFPGGGSTGYDPGLVQTCRYHACDSDADCDNGICVPPGFLAAVSVCVRAGCRSNAECNGGTCRILPTPDGSRETRCIAPEDECPEVCPPREDEYGNTRDQVCEYVEGVGRCVDEPEPVP